jgi:hypothetical protein
VTFAVFDTLESLNATEERVREIREQSVKEAGGEIISVHTYEIVGQA